MEEVKRRRGRPPKIEGKRAEVEVLGKREVPKYGKISKRESLEEIKTMCAASSLESRYCPVCSLKAKIRQKLEGDMLLIMSGGTTAEGHMSMGQLADEFAVTTQDLYRHRDICMKREAVLALDKTGSDIENSSAWITKLAKYLEVVDGVIERENMQAVPDPRVMLAGAESGRKICETNAKLFLELYRLRVDQRVQDDFMKIVLKVVEEIAPAAKDKIIEKLKGRLAMATASGV